ncbi:MAG: hypothetical protein ACOH2A_03515 [Sphingobacteriaceae bacterium]
MQVKPDFRKTLNTVLDIYYHKANPVYIHMELGNTFSPHDLTAAFGTLVKDGHMEHLAPGYSAIPLGCITGKGRIFLEAGGYKDETTKVDRIIRWAKNHPAIFWLFILVAVLATFKSLLDFVLQLVQLLKK